MKIFPFSPLSTSLQSVFSLLLGILLLLSSCSKDQIDAENLTIYLPAGSLNYNNGAASYVTARSNVMASKGTAFPVLLTRAFDQDVQVVATIDTSLLSIYDKANNTVSTRFPAGAFVLENNGQVRIPAGEMRSSDSLRIGLRQISGLDLSKHYIVPIRLASTNSNLPLSANRQVMYIRVTFNPITTQLNGLPANRVVPIIINRTPNGDVISGNVNLTAQVNTAFGQPLAVSLRDRQDLLASYNQDNQTNYMAFPANSFNFSPASVSIPGGSLNASSSFAIVLRNTNDFVPGHSYLLPVGIVDEGPIPPHETKSIAYFSVEVQLQNIDPANPAPTGNRVDRTGWTATASSTDNEYAPGATELAFDNNAATGWHSALDFGTSPSVTFTVDMQNQKQVRGFTFTPRYWDYFDSVFISAATGMRVASSTDGVNWTLQGAYTGSMPGGTVANPEIRNVSFYTAVQARYFRFTITAYGQYAGGFGELNAFE